MTELDGLQYLTGQPYVRILRVVQEEVQLGQPYARIHRVVQEVVQQRMGKAHRFDRMEAIVFSSEQAFNQDKYQYGALSGKGYGDLLNCLYTLGEKCQFEISDDSGSDLELRYQKLSDHIGEAAVVIRSTGGEERQERRAMSNLSSTYTKKAELLMKSERWQEALLLLEKSLAIDEQMDKQMWAVERYGAHRQKRRLVAEVRAKLGGN